jgi:hypothetical protein
VARLVLILLVACGSKHPGHGDAGDGDGDASVTTDSGNDAMTVVDARVPDAVPDAAMPDAFPGVLDVRINCHNDCVLIANPPSISVTAGTRFEVNWINVGDTECDVTKIDQFNHVPIILGLEPGMSYHDPVHQWCGPEFTGTFVFGIYICTIRSDIPVNCGA